MKFWRLIEPEYETDYQHFYVNGSLEHPFGLPGVKCKTCGTTWSSSRILPYPYPQELDLSNRWPISEVAHKALQDKVREALETSGYDVNILQPGDDLQPAYLDVPSTPDADFLWCSVGSVVISARMKALLTKANVTGMVFCPVTFRRIGKRSPKLSSPIPVTGEPEDILDEVELLTSTDELSDYYEMVITVESGKPPGTEIQHICPDCGRETYDKAARRLEMLPDMWSGESIFFLATTLWIVVTDTVKQAIEEARATNVGFVPLDAG